MARTQAKIVTACWSDPDWCSLPADAQRLYWLLISQPKLSLAGCLDLMPARWARLAGDTDEDDVNTSLEVLTMRRFVAVDDDELVVRTFVRVDLGVKANGNLVKGMWGAWRAIISPRLRKLVVDEMPDEVFDRCPDEVPDEARRMRSEPPLEWAFEPASERPSGPAPEPSVVGYLLSADCSTTSPQDNSQPEAVAPEPAVVVDEQTIRRTAALVGRTIAGDRGDAYAAGVTRRILTDPVTGSADRQRIVDALTAGQDPETIAAGWEPGDTLAGALYPSGDKPQRERHGPAMPEFRPRPVEAVHPDFGALRSTLAAGEAS